MLRSSEKNSRSLSNTLLLLMDTALTAHGLGDRAINLSKKKLGYTNLLKPKTKCMYYQL
jgi:hypothetical protein